MVNKRQKARMMDYVLHCLEGSGQKLKSGTGNIEEKEFNYLRVGDEEIVLMVDSIFTKPVFDKLYSQLRSDFKGVKPLFFKDRNTFFRSAAEDNYFKMKKELSLKKYKEDNEKDNVMQRMMLLRPEEISVINRKGGVLQYYQPESPRLEEGLVSYQFEPVRFDYGHIWEGERFKPQNTDSKRLFVWNKKIEHSDKIYSERFFLRDIAAPVKVSEVKKFR